MKAELFRETNGRFLPNELGDPTFLFHLFQENTSLNNILKFVEFFIIQFWNILVDSLLQSDFRRFTGTVQTLGLPIISNKFHFYGNFKTFYCNIVRLSSE